MSQGCSLSFPLCSLIASSFKMILIVLVLWTNWHFLAPNVYNPFEPLIFISYYLPDSTPEEPRFAKGPLVSNVHVLNSVDNSSSRKVNSLYFDTVGPPVHSVLRSRVVLRPSIPNDSRPPPFRPPQRIEEIKAS